MIEALTRQFVGMAKRLERLEVQERGPRWHDWTPTITQSGSVSCTITQAKYARIGKMVFVVAKLDVTGTGTAGNAIVIGGIPTAIAPAQTGSGVCVGSALVVDAGTTTYACSLQAPFSDQFYFRTGTNSGALGATPSFALASGDIISFTAMYEVA